MFLEVTNTVFQKLNPLFEQHNIPFQMNDCSLEKETNPDGSPFKMVHLEFGELTTPTIRLLAKWTDQCYGLVAVESKSSKEKKKPISLDETEGLEIS
jgi:hypothetical protein